MVEQYSYILDLICDAMEKRTNRIAPKVVGYYEGWHLFYPEHFPGISLDWSCYRRLLGSIQGLTIQDLPNTFCRKRQAARIIEEAEKKNVNSILCSCNGCYRSLQLAVSGRLQVVSVPEVLPRYF